MGSPSSVKKRSGVADQNIALFSSDFGASNSPKFKLTADGNAAFAGNITAGTYDSSGNDATGAIIHSGGYLGVQRTSAGAAATVFTVAQGDTEKINFRAGGTATFSGGVFSNFLSTSTNSGSFNFFKNAGGEGDLNSAFGTTNGVRTIQFYNNGSATFAGPVTAPNITFKLAPEIAAMPAPLIDEGFAANNEVNLLAELINMKLQIRDLNAFMQRTLQEQNETPQ